jgi:outer membrane receptor protein involved in Fe transport
VAADWFREDGWRDWSPSDVKQFFGKLSFRDADTEADLSLTHAQSRLVGAGLVPQSLLAERRENIFTHPDETHNDMTQLAFSGKRWLSEAASLSVNLYHRQTRTRTLNADMNADYAAPGDPTGALHRTQTTQHTTGGAVQWNLTTDRHQLALGTSLDEARIRFGQTSQDGEIDATRGVAPLGAETDDNRLRGKTRTASLYATDTVELAKSLHLTAAARYNASRVTTHDELNPTPPNLDGDHRYGRVNPALGLVWQATPTLDAYAGASQGTRIPTPIELGCADPAHPCTLPNAMAADPHLKQVVSRTLEAGLRGKAGDIRWNAGVFRTLNTDDILFVGTSTSAGYFTNYGKTLRQGLELGMAGSVHRVDWHVDYSWLQATFRSDACLLAQNNSTRGTAPECTVGGQDDEILVKRGDRIPGLPAHTLKLGASWRATDTLRLGADVQAFSSQYARGNENNAHQSGTYTDSLGTTRTYSGDGKIGGYAILNLNGDLKLGGGWQAFAKVNNVFDRRYATASALAENPFVGAGNAFDPNAANWRHETFVAPGAPRAVWVGVRYVFGGKS